MVAQSFSVFGFLILYFQNLSMDILYHHLTMLKSYIVLFIYLFVTAFGLRCCARAFSSCGEPGLLFVAVRGLLIAVASLVVEHGL